MQVAFTIKELRELTKIPDTRVAIDASDVSYLTPDILVRWLYTLLINLVC